MKIPMIADLIKKRYLPISVCSVMALALSSCEKKGGSAFDSSVTHTTSNGEQSQWENAVRIFDDEVEKVKNAEPMQIFPALLKDGKMQLVSVPEYIAAKIKGKKGKYHAVSVPDG